MTKRELLEEGVPINSLVWIRPSMLASVQHQELAAVLHLPLDVTLEFSEGEGI